MRNPMWPDHLYRRGKYFSWRHPQTGKEYGLGTDEADAISQAQEANDALAQRGLADRMSAPARTLGQFLPIYREHLQTLDRATRTIYSDRSCLKAIERHLSKLPIGVRFEDGPAMAGACFDFLKTVYVDAGKMRMAKVVRACLLSLFAHMIARGWLAINPVRDLELPAPKVKRQRLTLETFQAIYAAAEDEWLKRGMELGLVTLQRLDDVANMTFPAIRGGVLLVEQKKTDVRLRIPVGLRLNAVGWTLDDIVKRCRDSVVSRHLIHHTTHQGRAKPGMRVNPQTLSAAFTAARIASGIAIEDGHTPPTFHELRSLGIRLYEQQGYNPQGLAGHKQASTTALYRDDRGAEWIDVRAS